MSQHPNARLTPMGRRTLCERVEAGEPASAAARQMGVSRQTAHKWLRRRRDGLPMADATSRPLRSPMRTPDGVRDLVVRTRLELRCNPLVLAAVTGVPARTCSRIVSRAGCPALSEYDPVGGGLRPHGPATHVRYERDEPGDLVHVDAEKVARIPEGGGWRAHGRDGCDRQRARLQVGGLRRGPRLGRRVPHPHEALQPLAERQGRADEPDARPRVGLCPSLCDERREVRGPPGVP